MFPITSCERYAYADSLTRMTTVSTYGRNLRMQREIAKLTQEQIAKRLGISRQGNLPSIESGLDVPEPATVLRHAEAVGCAPSLLLRDVRTIYDRIRDGEFDSKNTEYKFAGIGVDGKDVLLSSEPVVAEAESEFRRRIKADLGRSAKKKSQTKGHR